MLMTDDTGDTGWNDFGAYSLGGVDLAAPRRMSTGCAVFTNWYDQALHRRPLVVHHRPHFTPIGAVDPRYTARRKLPAKRNADDRRILPEERLLDILLWKVASRRQA
jgi:hypothetical protein